MGTHQACFNLLVGAKPSYNESRLRAEGSPLRPAAYDLWISTLLNGHTVSSLFRGRFEAELGNLFLGKSYPMIHLQQQPSTSASIWHCYCGDHHSGLYVRR